MILQNRREDTHPKLDGDREEVTPSLLGNLGTARNAWKVDEAGLDETLSTLQGLQQLLSEPDLLLARSIYAKHVG
jgi:hypothetical protein